MSGVCNNRGIGIDGMFGWGGIERVKEMVKKNFPESSEDIFKSVNNAPVSSSSHIVLENKKENKSYKLLWVTGDYWALFLLGDEVRQLDFFEWNEERALSMLQSIFGEKK
ncbi:MAG: hypothetical protein GX765_00790 [Candidatus Moranbacteria bacterium]|jgi:hypothetical protein|nr:hypothetical protein [Candidatus Moranbacteria bacterium]